MDHQQAEVLFPMWSMFWLPLISKIPYRWKNEVAPNPGVEPGNKIILFYKDDITKPMAYFQDGP